MENEAAVAADKPAGEGENVDAEKESQEKEVVEAEPEEKVFYIIIVIAGFCEH